MSCQGRQVTDTVNPCDETNVRSVRVWSTARVLLFSPCGVSFQGIARLPLTARSARVMVSSQSSFSKSSSTGDPSLTRYLKQIGGRRLLSRDEERDLAIRARAGDQGAADNLVEANLRFVVKIAKKYQHQGLPLEDLISEGNIGLMNAVKRFDERKGFKFISYGVWWVRQAIVQALIDKGRVVRPPANRINRFHKVKKSTGRLEQRLGRPPTLGEISGEVEISPGTLLSLLEIGATTASLDSPVENDRAEDDHDECPLINFTAVDRGSLADDIAEENSLKRDLYKAMGQLSEREAWVLGEYFGLTGDDPKTLQAIGREVGLTKERIRQLKKRALGKLREPDVAGGLAGYLDMSGQPDHLSA